jgi:hypothetical protein
VASGEAAVRRAIVALVAACAASATPPPGLAAGRAGEGSVSEASRRQNRLAKEKSPYLLQHASNPVDWYPWGEEAFARARREDRPIFLSVGYSTCHWCHVMERESFEDQGIASILNRHFVSIKVDREERPDVDRVYMKFVQATTGSGGWPMSVFLTPDLKPFFGGTYFPPDERYGRPGFRQVLERLAEAWALRRGEVVASGNQILEALRREVAASSARGALPGPEALDNAFRRFEAEFDPRHGGFGGAPKFPRPAALGFLLRHHARTGEARALDMTLRTLRGMAEGGMYDQLGGGFHRYSVDERWHLPHFEKMLYDQAQLAIAYLEGYLVTKELALARVARETLDYVLRDLTHPGGGFYSAEDADSAADPSRPGDKREGAFYVWRAEEIRRAIGDDLYPLFAARYGVSRAGNLAHDPHGEFGDRNVLRVARDLDALARESGMKPEELERRLDGARRRLLEVRATRPRPHLDDKVIAAWNGLMITALARSGAALGEPRYVEAAARAARFARERLADPRTGTLRRRWRDGEAAFDASSLDYSAIVQAHLDLYDATFDPAWLAEAERLQDAQIERFWDASAGGFWETAGDDPSVLVRMKEDYDGAEPASSSLAALNLQRLAQLTGRGDLRDKAVRTLEAFSTRLRELPQALPAMLSALADALGKPRQIVIAGSPEAEDTRALLDVARARFLPNTVLVLADGGAGQEALGRRLPFLRSIKPVGGKATAYVCVDYACDLPTADPGRLAALLDRGPARR